jgi:hypothetical protein
VRKVGVAGGGRGVGVVLWFHGMAMLSMELLYGMLMLRRVRCVEVGWEDGRVWSGLEWGA